MFGGPVQVGLEVVRNPQQGPLLALPELPGLVGPEEFLHEGWGLPGYQLGNGTVGPWDLQVVVAGPIGVDLAVRVEDPS